MRVFSILGPAHSGKSTLMDALARLDGRPTPCSVGDIVTLTGFTYLDEPWTGIEVDGGSDAIAQAGPALAISDAAILCVPPDPEAAVLAAPYLRKVEEAGIPCFLFINRMDNPNGRIRDIVSALQAYCRHHITLRQVPIRENGEIIGAVDLISERAWRYREGEPSVLIEMPKAAQDREQEARAELLEELSDYDDHLLEQLIEDKQPPCDEIYHLAADTLQHHALIPAYLGAASHNNGVTRLMKALRHETPSIDVAAERTGADTDTRAIAGFADMRKHMGKVTVLRGLGEGVTSHDALGGANVGSLVALDGKSQIDAIAQGDIALAVKSDHLMPGSVYSAGNASPFPDWANSHAPNHRELITPAHDRDDVRLSNALARMVEIDPGLSMDTDPASGHAIIGTQGPIHLRRLAEKLDADFSVEIDTQSVAAEYRETIQKPVEHQHRHRKQSGGAGQFADVKIKIEPQPRGEGYAFDEVVKGGAVPRNFIPSVGSGAQEALAQGPNGHPVVDVKVTLLDGKHHSVDSSDFAFRTAGKAAVREALAEAKPVVLQPILRAEIHVPSAFVGDLVPMISTLQGQVLGFEAHSEAAGWDVFTALLPAVSRDELSRSLAGASRGTAWADYSFDHYEELRGAPSAAAR